MFATVEVSLSDFDLDDVIEYVEDEGYIVEKASDRKHDEIVSEQSRKYNSQEEIIEMLNNRVTARDYLTDILELTHHASESEILERVKQIINQ